MTNDKSITAADDFTRYIADHIPGRVAYWDRDLRCLFVNKMFCDWFGKERTEVIGRRIIDIFDEQQVHAIRDHLNGALLGEAQQFDSAEVGPDGGAATMRVRYDPDVRDGEVHGFFALALEVTDLLESEQRLQRMNAELEIERDRAQASAKAKSRFLANMSHEIRTPMNAIIGLTHLMRRDPNGPQSAERLARVAEAAERLLDLVNDVLDLSKIESGTLALGHGEFDVQAMMAHLLGPAEMSAREKGLTLTADVTSLPRLLRGDGTRLSQMLANLLANAVKFTISGSISLVGTPLETRGQSLHVRFEVRDTGIGIAADRLDRIFSVFEQADGSATRRFGGGGLGLGLTRHLAQLMGGDAGATSELGVGSLFWIDVVLQRIGAETAQERGVTGPLVGRRALLVDDLAEAHALVEPMMRRLGLQVELATSGFQALAAARAAEDDGTPFDVVLIDWLMPHMDGLETARRLLAQAQGEAPKCILVSVSADQRMRDQALALGVTSLLQKPISYSTLHDHLMSLLFDPRSDLLPQLAHEDAERLLRETHGGATVLVAEDNPVNQDVARTLLTLAGLNVDIAANGHEAIAMATATAYALILMDVQMPELDGMAAARRLRAQPFNAATPIIAITANAHADDRDACLAAGMNDYLTKPVDAITLYTALTRWIAPRLPASQAPPGAPIAAAPPVLDARAEHAIDAIDAMAGIEGLNTPRGLEFLGGNRTAYRDTLLTMIGLYAAGLPEARSYLEGATPWPEASQALRRGLHSVGGACAALGLETLSDSANRIGIRLRTASTHSPEIDDDVREFCATLDRVLGQIRDRLASLQK